MIKHNLEREKTEDYELMQKISEDKGEKSSAARSAREVCPRLGLGFGLRLGYFYSQNL